MLLWSGDLAPPLGKKGTTLNVLVFNCGSSSLSFKIFQVENGEIESVVLSGKAHRVGVKGSEPSFLEYKRGNEADKETVPLENHQIAARFVLKYVKDHGLDIDAIGHRFVHGGQQFATSAMIDEKTLAQINRCLPLAPIHNPISKSVIEESIATYSELPQYVTFDTAFHSGMPARAYTYALPEEIRRRHGFRKFGFHGLSYTYVTRVALDYLGLPTKGSRLVACHLGTGGSSVAAIQDGQSIDTSMGYSPLAGLVMSTRSGDVDPMMLLYLMDSYGFRELEIEEMLNKKSGLIGISEFSSDLRDILSRMNEESGEGEEQAGLAFSMYCHRLRKVVGSYIAALGGIDALIFTDDIGVTNAPVREKVCEGLGWAGVSADPELNPKATKDAILTISPGDAPVKVLTVPTDEERVIVWEGIRLLKEEVSV